jgi:hypothetical protein
MDAANLRGRAGNCRGERHERGVRVLCPALHAHVACLRCIRRWADRLTCSRVGMSERRAGQRTSGQTRCRSHREDSLPHRLAPSVNDNCHSPLTASGAFRHIQLASQDRASCRFFDTAGEPRGASLARPLLRRDIRRRVRGGSCCARVPGRPSGSAAEGSGGGPSRACPSARARAGERGATTVGGAGAWDRKARALTRAPRPGQIASGCVYRQTDSASRSLWPRRGVRRSGCGYAPGGHEISERGSNRCVRWITTYTHRDLRAAEQ